jgi:hypothetical protein
MYVRSHIDTVSGDRKYIYIDENNKKYIRNKNKYYPIKKYKGAYSLQKIRGGVGGASIKVNLHLYGIKDADGKVSEDAKTFETTIDLSNIVLNPDDKIYEDIIEDNKISIYNKGFASVDTDFTSNNINHFITIKNVKNIFKVYFKNYTGEGNHQFDIKPYSSFYNIIYKRNNRIDKDSEATSEETFFVIFSIIEDFDATDFKLDDKYIEIPDVYNKEYNSLYDTTLDKLKKIYQ